MENDLSGHKDRNNRTLLIGQSNEVTKQKKFMICELCLWCASSLYFNNTDITITECPICDSSRKLDSIPICDNENYSFNYDSKSGVILEFSKSQDGDNIILP